MNFTYKNLLKLLFLPALLYLANDVFQFLAEDIYLLYSIDTYSHFLGGIVIAYSASYGLDIMEKRRWISIQKPILKCVIILSVVMAVAVWWEFYEFIYDYFLNPIRIMQPGVGDTMKDLYMGMFGVIVFCVKMLYKSDKK
jgi:hypothetical protein